MPVSKSNAPGGNAFISSFFLGHVRRHPPGPPARSVPAVHLGRFAHSACRQWLALPLLNCSATVKPSAVAAPSRFPATGSSASAPPCPSPPPVCSPTANYTHLLETICLSLSISDFRDRRDVYQNVCRDSSFRTFYLNFKPWTISSPRPNSPTATPSPARTPAHSPSPACSPVATLVPQ